MIRREKWLELMKIVFITHLNTFGSKVLLSLKFMDFKNALSTKVIHMFIIEGMNAYYTWCKINFESKCIYIQIIILNDVLKI